MTPDDFAQVCMHHHILKTAAARGRLTATLGDVPEDATTEDLFDGLRSKWLEREAELAQRIEQVDDPALKKVLLARVHRHNTVGATL